MLRFSYGNTKLKELEKYLSLPKKSVIGFDLPAGFTCPKAEICRTFANPKTGKLKRVGHVLCYAAKIEQLYPNTRKAHWYNFEELIQCYKNHDSSKMVEMIQTSLPKTAKIVRIHSSGDYFCEDYFKAWLQVARNNPCITFYGYTKILAYCQIMDKPDNFYLQYSHGGKDDKELDKLSLNIPTCYIGESDKQYPNIPVVCNGHANSHEDYFAILRRESFVILMH